MAEVLQQQVQGSQLFAPRKSLLQTLIQGPSAGIDAQTHKCPGEGEKIIKPGAQPCFLLLGKVVAGFAEPSARARDRGGPPFSPPPSTFWCIFVQYWQPARERENIPSLASPAAPSPGQGSPHTTILSPWAFSRCIFQSCGGIDQK